MSKKQGFFWEILIKNKGMTKSLKNKLWKILNKCLDKTCNNSRYLDKKILKKYKGNCV